MPFSKLSAFRLIKNSIILLNFPWIYQKLYVYLDVMLNIPPPITRLTFWLSNSIVLRAIVTQAVEKLHLAAVPSINNNGGPKGRNESSPGEAEKTDRTESSDEWAEPQPYIAALKKVEAWIFSRIVESVWWQVPSSPLPSN